MNSNTAQGLTIEESLEPGCVVVKLIGLADSDSSTVLEREVLRLNALRAALIVFDLSQLTFISSLAIGPACLISQGPVTVRWQSLAERLDWICCRGAAANASNRVVHLKAVRIQMISGRPASMARTSPSYRQVSADIGRVPQLPFEIPISEIRLG